MSKLKLFYFLLLFVTLSACQKEMSLDNTEITSEPNWNTSEEKLSVLKEVSEVLKIVYQDPKAVYEVNAAILSEYYEDERVLLRDLLDPERSPIYQTKRYVSLGAQSGTFRNRFFDAVNKGDFPNLRKKLRLQKQSSGNQIEPRIIAATPIDTSMEIFRNSAGVSIYFPYSENFGSNYSPAYFDAINNGTRSVRATIVTADRDANSGPGQEPFVCGTRDNPTLCYRLVTVNDTYAETRITHIVGVRAEPRRPIASEPIFNPGMTRIFHGWSKIGNRKQYDPLISITGNGGGSEIRVCRISGFLQLQNQQVTNFAGDQIAIHYKRREIARGIWKRVYGVWDPNWATSNSEQVYAVYEEDNQGTITFTGSLSTTIRVDSGSTISGSIGFNVQAVSQDAPILQRKISRTTYLRGARLDQGWGFQMCHPNWCGFDNTFLNPNQFWPKYDEGSDWAFTWPFRTF